MTRNGERIHANFDGTPTDYGKSLLQLLDAGDLAYQGASQLNSDGKWQYNWFFFLPLGMALGWGLVHLVVTLLKNDQFLFPVVISASTYAVAGLCVVAAGAASALVVRRRIDRLDMVGALKTRE